MFQLNFIVGVIETMYIFILSDNDTGSYYTGGYGEGGRSWWSTGEMTTYVGQALDNRPEHNYIYLKVESSTRLFDGSDNNYHFVCETCEWVSFPKDSSL